ncbi:MAG: transporter [Terracidiphilus sp.]
MQRFSLLLLAFFVSSPFLPAQDGFFGNWERRATATQSVQPAWPPPLVTTYVGLIQVARADFIRQTASNHTETWNLDGGKGLNLIPLAHTELDVNLPPYLVHSVPTAINGAGDMSFVLKYRYLSGNAHHGNYDLSAFLASTIPTGSYKNGALDPTVSPNVGFGKGIGVFDVQSTLGASMPVADTVKLGRTIIWNTAFQAHVVKYFWPEVELNATYYKGGPNDGKVQNFVTPGLLFARKFHPKEAGSRLGICVGAGEQIATSHFHGYNHEIAVTTRLLF